MVIDDDEIAGVECKHAVYMPPPLSGEPDLHLIKEIIHKKDGTQVPSIRFESNYKMNFWVTRKGFRRYQQKKEAEHLDRLQMYETTRSKMPQSIANALGTPWVTNEYDLYASQYLYGADILSTARIKAGYQKKYANTISRNSIAVLDLETDVINGTETAIMGSITMGSRVTVCILKSFVKGINDVKEKIVEMADKHIGHHLRPRNATPEILLVDSDVDIHLELIKRAHAWRPDFLVFWNVLFDMGKILEALARGGYEAKDVFSDPAVPEEYRYFHFKEGPKTKVTESGKTMPLKPADRWHTYYVPASFYIIDAMCVYKRIRIGEAELPSYKLDYVLATELKDVRKLKFDDSPDLSGLDWHKYMQTMRKIEYIVYNIFDCVCVELLDEKTHDLGVKISLYSGCSDYANFKSEPRRTCDEMHYYLLEDKQSVIGTTAKKSPEEEEADAETLSIKGWINTLSAHRVAQNGLKIIKELPHLLTNVRRHVADLDVSGAYPTNQETMNVSRKTTVIELCNYGHIPEDVGRMQGINLSGGATNSLEFCQSMFGLPVLPDLLDAFVNELKTREDLTRHDSKAA